MNTNFLVILVSREHPILIENGKFAWQEKGETILNE